MVSIARRVYLMSFVLSSAAIVVMLLAVSLVNEDLEQTMLDLDFASQRDFIVEQNVANQKLQWQTANLVAIYLPGNETDTTTLPAMFTGLPADYTGEWEEEGREYLINVETVNEGLLYLARDITLFETREALFDWILIGCSVVIVLLSFILAVIASRRLIKPLVLLSEQIRATPVGQKMPRLSLDLPDQELLAIAQTFNDFLVELEHFVKREYALINLASHELRTPISVVLGAVEVLETRGSLQKKDGETLKRVKRAAQDMEINITTMLKLARREESTQVSAASSLAELLEMVIEDLSSAYPVYQRISLTRVIDKKIVVDPELVKMLLRNLLQNALQHTTSEIDVEIAHGKINISDRGQGLNEAQRSILTGKDNFEGQRSLGGLGLYIVTLICEKLQWTLSVSNNPGGGTTIEVECIE